MSMNIGTGYLKLQADQTPLKKDLKSAENISQKSVGKLQGIFNKINLKSIGIAAFATGAVYSFKRIIESAAATGDQFHKMSLRTGVASEELSALGYAAKISGTDIDAVEKSLRYLSQQMLDMERGTGTAKDTFNELGISIKDSEGNLRSVTSIMTEVADKIMNMTDETKKAAYASEIFGARSGTQLLPMLRLGSKGIEELTQKAKELGIVIGTEDAQKAAEFTDAMTDLKGATSGLARELAIGLLPVLTSIATEITNIISKLDEFKQGYESFRKWTREKFPHLYQPLPWEKEGIFGGGGRAAGGAGAYYGPPGPTPKPMPIPETFEYKRRTLEIFGKITRPELGKMWYYEEPPWLVSPEVQAERMASLMDEIKDKSEDTYRAMEFDFESVFCNTFERKLSGLSDNWSFFCDQMKRNFLRATAEMIVQTPLFREIERNMEAIITGMFKSGGVLYKSIRRQG